MADNLGDETHVNMVTALFGTVRKRLIDNPLYKPRHPSSRTIRRAAWTSPLYLFVSFDFGFEFALATPSAPTIPMPFPGRNRRCICKRVRTTSWGYVAMEAVILEIAEHRRMVLVVRGAEDVDSGMTMRMV